VRAVTDLPLAVGFGISKPEHVAELGRQVEAWWWAARWSGSSSATSTTPRSRFSSNLFVRELKRGFGAQA